MKFWSNSEIPEIASQVPEKRLLAAVLQRAITDFFTGEGDLKDNAQSWLSQDELDDAPLSYKFVCEALDLDAESLRKAIFNQVAVAIDSQSVALAAVAV
jgi:hypothetical protein